MNDLMLGSDLGTRAIKVGIFTPESAVIRLTETPTPISGTGTESAEHNARDLWNLTANLIREAVQGHSDQLKARGAC